MTIAISMGDPSGIGPEIAIKAWQYFAKNNIAANSNKNIDFAIVGDAEPFRNAATNLGLSEIIGDVSDIALSKEIFNSKLPILDVCHLAQRAIIGIPNSNNGTAIIKSIELASNLVIEKRAKALVTLPIAKSVLYECGFSFAGHTEFVADLCKDLPFKSARGPVMMLAIDGLKVALVTIHEPLAKVPSLLTVAIVQNTIRVVNDALKNDFGIGNPRIALLGLNPHAGENGKMGLEEVNIINPAASMVRKEGIDCTKAMPADSAFNPNNRAKFDCFIAMYHDQGLIPIKTLDYWGGVNISIGLPIIRTSPDHGTGFDLAPKYCANPQSLINAIKAASELANNRAARNG